MADPNENAAVVDVETLYRRHAAWVARYVTRLGFRGQDVEDIVQEVFLVAHRSGGFRPGPAKPTTWLAEIAFRVASAARRKQSRTELAGPGSLDEVPAMTAGPAAQAQSAQALAHVQRALETLDLDKRALFVLFEIEGEDCNSLAAAFGVPVGTIYSRLHATRKAFLAEYKRLTTSKLTPVAGAP